MNLFYYQKKSKSFPSNVSSWTVHLKESSCSSESWKSDIFKEEKLAFFVKESADRDPNCLDSFSVLILREVNVGKETISFEGSFLNSAFIDLYSKKISIIGIQYFRQFANSLCDF